MIHEERGEHLKTSEDLSLKNRGEKIPSVLLSSFGSKVSPTPTHLLHSHQDDEHQDTHSIHS